MNKKILIFVVLATLMLVTITFATAIQTTNTNKKESPLYKIRTKLAIGERIQNLKTKFIGERIFFLPSLLLRNQPDQLSTTHQWTDCSTIGCKFGCGYSR